MTDQLKYDQSKYNSDADQYPHFESLVAEKFNQSIANGEHLFTTNVDTEAMWSAYLYNLPSGAPRSHYDCHGCKQFIQRFGGLVTQTHQGDKVSAIWDVESTPKFFANSVKAMNKLVERSVINGVFIPESATLGTPRTGEWTHLSAKLPKSRVHKDRLKTAHQVHAEKVHNFETLTNAILSFDSNTIDTAVQLLQSDTLYRADKVTGKAVWFSRLVSVRNQMNTSERKRNVVWMAVANAPAGFTSIRSGSLGRLFETIESGMSFEQVQAEFRKIMDPENYMRSQSAPTTNALYEAERVVAKLGIAESLRRKYAKLEDIPEWLWKDKGVQKLVSDHKPGVFSHLAAKSAPGTSMMIPPKVMTWEKFQRTVLPTADKLEVLVDNPSRMMALVTEAVPNSPNILQWDNPFSWYYHGGIDGEIKRRVESAGGRYENNEIRASLIWEGYTDLDLHVITPDNTHISFSRPRSHCGGWLDIDMNGGSHRNASPVENIRWASNAPNGKYKVYVHNYCERGTGKTPYTVELEIAGQTFTFNGIAGGTNYTADAFIFEYEKGKAPKILSQTYTADNSWNVPTGEFVKVKGITKSPNLWGDRPVTHSGTHTFFILEGAKDDSEGKGRGFFNEILKSDLRPMRKTLELYTGSTPIEGVDEATACGVGYSKDSEWNLTLKVTSGNSSRLVKIDRWD